MKKSYILIGIFLIIIIVITIIGSFIVTGNNELDQEKYVLLTQGNKEVYFNVYGYSVDNPNVIVNPYGNSPLTAIVMFETDDYSEVKITIKGKDNSDDINYKFSKDKYHIIPIYGLYPNYNNIVIIESENKKKIIQITTDKLPDDFEYVLDNKKDNFVFYNGNYPYALDINGEVRWFLNKHYYGNITVLDNASIIVGSDRYNEYGNTISFYKMNLLGKIYSEYLLEEDYYGYNTIYKDNILVLSSKILLIDIQTGEIISEYIKNDDFNCLSTIGDNIVVCKNNSFFQLNEGSLEKIEYNTLINKSSFYNDVNNYKIVPYNRFGELGKTEVSGEKISLINYNKLDNLSNITIVKEFDRLKIVNNYEDKIYIILEKFLDKKVYEVDSIKYINFTGLSGKYTIYFKIDNTVYKTNYFVEV